MRVAVVGSGIAGLSTAWCLSQNDDNDVYVYEANAKAGLDSRAVDVNTKEGNDFGVDLPLRVFSEKYYPNLLRLYRTVGVEVKAEDFSTSFNVLGGSAPVFRYKNWLLGKMSLPYLPNVFRPAFLRIAFDFLRFSFSMKRDLKGGKLTGVTFGEYVQGQNLSSEFVHSMLIPVLAGICTCSYDSVKQYPADIIVAYMTNRDMYGVRRAVNGTRDIVRLLTPKVKCIKTSCAVTTVDTLPSGKVLVEDVNGDKSEYDHVIIAAQAHHALKMLANPTLAQRKALDSFKYDRARAIVHTDETLLPSTKTEWSACNVTISDQSDMPMVSIWMNKAMPSVPFKHLVVQTWNPHVEPAKSKILADEWFERPVMTFEAAEGIKVLKQCQGEGGIWFCGSYSLYGMPLLENAVTAGLDICKQLGSPKPWSDTPASTGGATARSGGVSLEAWAVVVLLGIIVFLVVAGSGCVMLLRTL